MKFRASEAAARFRVFGFKGLEGSTFTRTVTHIEALKKGSAPMSQLTPEFMQNRMLWIFRHHDGEGTQTKSFANFSKAAQEEMNKEIQLRRAELAVLACWRSRTDRVAVTTERICWHAEGRCVQLELTELADATVRFEDLAAAGPGGKLDVTALWLVSKNGDYSRLVLEAGAPLLACLNVLKWIAARADDNAPPGPGGG